MSILLFFTCWETGEGHVRSQSWECGLGLCSEVLIQRQHCPMIFGGGPMGFLGKDNPWIIVVFRPVDCGTRVVGRDSFQWPFGHLCPSDHSENLLLSISWVALLILSALLNQWVFSVLVFLLLYLAAFFPPTHYVLNQEFNIFLKIPQTPAISWCTGELLSTSRLGLGMEHRKLSTTCIFLGILGDCCVLHGVAGRSQVTV